MKTLITKFALLSLATVSTVFTSKAQDMPAQNPTDSVGSEVIKLRDEMDVLKRLKVTGWVQTQYQHADSAGVFGFTGGYASGASNVPTRDRIMIRRGRVKFTYENEFSQYVMQFDATERSITIREAFVKFFDKKWQAVGITTGLQNRPFGYEIQQSSAVRETPERSRFTQTITPNERDLGAMVTVQMPKSSPLHIFKLDAGLFNGTQLFQEIDNKKDFIGRLAMTKTTRNEKLTFGVALSCYDGYVRRNTKYAYKVMDVDNTTGFTKFILDSASSNIATFGKREYYGADFQVTYDFPFGLTTLRGEYTQGIQTATDKTTTSPSTYDATAIAMTRHFDAAYFYFVQNIGQTPFQLVYKYDWYDPNTKIKGDQIGLAGTKTGTPDIKYTTQGFGLNIRWNSHVKIMCYYDLVKNETSKNFKPFYNDLHDNVLTVRVQYRF